MTDSPIDAKVIDDDTKSSGEKRDISSSDEKTFDEPESKKHKDDTNPDTDVEENFASADSSNATNVPSTDIDAVESNREKVDASPMDDPSDKLDSNEEKVDVSPMDDPSDEIDSNEEKVDASPVDIDNKENEGHSEVAKTIEVVDADNVSKDTINALPSQ